jgi:hypothetical protein
MVLNFTVEGKRCHFTHEKCLCETAIMNLNYIVALQCAAEACKLSA